MRYNHFDMLPERAFLKVGGRITLEGGGGSPAPQPTTQTVQQTNIPEYAQPYVETMLGTAQQQVYTYDPSGNVTGIKGYTPYSVNPQDYVAPFSPMQQQAFGTAAGLQTPGQFASGTGAVGAGALGTLGIAGQLGGYGQMAQQQLTDPTAQKAYMSPYMQNVVDYQKTEALRDYNIGQQLRKAQAVGQGAFGGSRQAIVESEAQRALGSQIGGIEAKGAQQAFQQGQAAQQAALGMGLQGLSGAQSGYGQLGQLGTQFGALGTQQLAAQQGVINTQATLGAQQQAQQQNIINQAIQNYAMAQQYPQAQLQFMNALLRGLPLQATTTSGYQAAPSTVSQMAGLGTAGLAAYGLANRKKGGVIKEKRDGIDSLALYDTMKGAK